jgi:hypothetical protein
LPSTRKKAPILEGFRPVRQPAFIELGSLNDIGRLACALERAPLPLFAIKDNADSGYLISTQLDIFLGVPVFYYARSPDTKHYLAYRTTAIGEEVSLTDSQANPTFAYAPVIEVVRMPKIFEKGVEGNAKYEGTRFLSIQVKDLLGLAKVASYKVLFEEPPLPMFAFPSDAKKDGKWKVGSFTRIEEYEEASIFFYCELDSKPEQNFVKYSMSRAEAFMTNRTDEHGSLYVKIIRVNSPHPLVETGP